MCADPDGGSPDAGTSSSDGDADARRRHALRNLVLAARLRVDALRHARDVAAAAPHLDALDACLARAVELLATDSPE